jgi:hypothetical protein
MKKKQKRKNKMYIGINNIILIKHHQHTMVEKKDSKIIRNCDEKKDNRKNKRKFVVFDQVTTVSSHLRSEVKIQSTN